MKSRLKQIQSIIPKAVDEEILKYGVARQAMRRWDEVVGPTLSLRSWPDRYDKGVVWVAVAGSAWAQELRLMKVKILARLEEFSGSTGLFVDIRFGVRKLPDRSLEELEVKETPVEVAPTAELSMREIASRRFKKWRDVESG